MAMVRSVEPGCLAVAQHAARFYRCKLLFSVDVRRDGSGAVLMLASDDTGCRPLRDWNVSDDPGGLNAEVTWWP